jgi:hypothetical protein
MKNKKGWIRIIEAFVAVLLIMGIILLLIGQKQNSDNNFSKEIYEKEVNILREIQLNQTLRSEILSSPVPASSIQENLPEGLENKVLQETPSYLQCLVKICYLEEDCYLEGAEIEIKKNIYSRSVPIFSNLSFYSPRQIKLFCWEKDSNQ